MPTWNFAVVHATGRLKAIDEPAQKHALLSSLIRKYKTAIGGTAYDFAALPMEDVHSPRASRNEAQTAPNTILGLETLPGILAYPPIIAASSRCEDG